MPDATPPYLRVELCLESMTIQADLDLYPVQTWWRGVCERNHLSRQRDDGGDQAPLLTVRVRCPHCGANAHQLVLLSTDSGARECSCRACGTRIVDES